MRQKKKTETEKSMEENKKKLAAVLFLPEIGCMLLACGGIYGLSLFRQETFDITLNYMVMAVLGIAVVGFHLRREYVNEELHYDNGEHLGRFWTGFLAGLLLAFACVFLPAEGWPFQAVFVMLALFGSSAAGILASAILLMTAVFLSGASTSVFFLYLLSGVFAVSLFRPMKNEVKIGIPLFLSLLCLLVCQTANLILTANARPSVEMFVVPVANIIISGILILGIVKLFSNQVIYRYRIKYLELNDTGNPVLTEYRQSCREDYFQCVHTAYFCERIAGKLSLDADALKCAGYYHKKGEEIFSLVTEKQFPPDARCILEEYLSHMGIVPDGGADSEKNGAGIKADGAQNNAFSDSKSSRKRTQVRHKETAVLLCADTVVNTMIRLLAKNKDGQLDYDRIIDAVFKRFMDAGTFDYCDISLRELRTMQKIFKEEKLYYDFLR